MCILETQRMTFYLFFFPDIFDMWHINMIKKKWTALLAHNHNFIFMLFFQSADMELKDLINKLQLITKPKLMETIVNRFER